MLTSPKENVTLGPGIEGEDEARQQCGRQRSPEPPAAWTQTPGVCRDSRGLCGRWRQRGAAEWAPLSHWGV